ncbi:23S ribosomal RNA methyltransferase Erm [Nocardioides hwasunensis]|uniref:23S ribosomal RNA methyltransferase Erm n=1 Tax=Nocardioides hwasunensis TaxID=397258 RepID=A0ABR8MK07_9ACTN|nr:23S ribosomal RNA methyltransferase Erm [Nocardioides hwasunensis]MBD3914834.1 23S ribosomal RNA methyltransferase Erm [Nocardioides hwasunensis]
MSRSTSRSVHGGRHELGQNFLHHAPTLDRIARLVADTDGAIIELGAGDGALTRVLVGLGRDVTAIDLDEHLVRRLRTAVPDARVVHADALTHPLDRPVVVGNVPFHLTTPILRRLLREPAWEHAVLLVQWEVARKRAGVGGGTMMTAQAAPWFDVGLAGRVPAHGFTPKPSVDGGLLRIERRPEPLVPPARRTAYERFVHGVFTGRGGSLHRILQAAARVDARRADLAMERAQIDRRSLPRDLTPRQWADLWHAVRG